MLKYRRIVLLAVPLTVILCSGVFAFDNGDFQFWTKNGASADISKDWKADVTEELKLGKNAANFYYQETDLTFVYSGLAKWLDLGLGYGLIFEKDYAADEWFRENRWHTEVTFKWKMSNWSLSDRNKFEFRDRENAKNLWRYRNKFTVKLPCRLTPLKFQPYFADEVYINFDDQHFNRNRFYVGAAKDIGKRLTADIYYMLQCDRKGHDYTNYNVLGVGLKLRF
jgi:hypothetical protein